MSSTSLQSTLIFTDSTDTTTDLLLTYIPNSTNRVFRFNFDLLGAYDLWVQPDYFQIIDPVGRRIDSHNIKKAYYRKPRSILKADFVQNESWYLYKEVINLCWQQSKIVLVEPYAEQNRVSKFYQLRMAKHFFEIPESLLITQVNKHALEATAFIIKSLTGGFASGKRVFSTRVDPARLELASPWFLQHYIEATHDLTVVYLRDRLFAFQLRRDFLEHSIDFRSPLAGNTWQKWEAYPLSTDFAKAIHGFMGHILLDYGRLDFLITPTGKIVFCEVNPNGQFAWLDLANTQGLLSAVVHEISPETETHPIPYNPFER